MTHPSIEALLALAREAEDASSFPGSPDHGVVHWRGVADQAIWLAETLRLGREIRLAAFAFGAIHDCRRLNEGFDPEHGPRAAAWLHGSDWIARLGLERLGEDLLRSLALHDRGLTARDDDPVVSLGWDADRSLLSRVGIDPRQRYFTLAQDDLFDVLIARAERVICEPERWTDLARRALA